VNGRFILALLLLAGSACVPPALRPRVSYEANPQAIRSSGIVIFQDSSGALSYQAPAGRDVRKLVTARRVQGRACQRGFQLPTEPLVSAISGSVVPTATSISATWGDGGYRDAMDDARRGLPSRAVLYDVRADLATLQILSIYYQRCVQLDAAVALPLETVAPAATSQSPRPPLPPSAAP
jgi:hypothetical protein